MRVLMLNTHDIAGGAARATFRLREALLRGGVDARMLVSYRMSDVNTVIALSDGIFGKALRVIRAEFDRLPVRKYRRTMNGNWGPFSPARVRNRKLVRAINAISPDIVHLCWICGGMIAVEDLAEIKAPIVWRLPDMWAFTGGCHYAADLELTDGNVGGNGAGDCGNDDIGGRNESGLNCDSGVMCDKYVGGCYRCGVLGSNRDRDLSYRVFERKRRAFAKIPGMTVIGVSKWLAGCAERSALFGDKKVVCLPNPVDTNVFKPVDKHVSRLLWNLPNDKKLILFGAAWAASTPYKGYDLLLESLKKISSVNVECVVFGANEPKNKPDLPYKIRYVGHLGDDVSLASLYGACDVMVIPSRREAFGQTASESLSCGTPVVAFGVGGLPDIVDHELNGYLARPFDTGDLAKGIDWILGNDDYEKLSENARAKTVREFDYGVVAGQYIDVYRKVLG